MNAAHAPIIDQYCVFQAGGATWAVSAACVREVTDLVPVVPVPETSDFLLGVCHLRTEFLPVLDLILLVGESVNASHSSEYLLVLDGNEGSWAIPIQRALTLAPLEVAIHDTVGHAGRASGGLLGTASNQGEVVRVLDVRQLGRLAADALEMSWRAPATLAANDTFNSETSIPV